MQILLIKIFRFFRLIARMEFRELVRRFRKRMPWLKRYYFSFSVSDKMHLAVKERFTLDAAVAFDNFLYSNGRLSLSTSDHPEVTILIVLFNKVEFSYLCLKSLAALGNSLKYSVVIIDNASTDRTALLLDRTDGAVILHNAKNIGFLRACNQGRSQINAEYLLLLNNDTEVPPGSLEIALKTFKTTPQCGAVGARLVRPDGTLQEAGNILWNDGTCVGYLRNEEPTTAEAMYRRETDYCSGAFLLTKTALFKEIGFDEQYVPAYYEETDYCVELKKRGLKIIYEPRALIHHFEYGSAGLTAKAMTQMALNCGKFREKHKEFLSTLPAPTTSVINHRSASHKKRILVLEDYPPNVKRGAGFPRSNLLVNFMHELGYEVTVYTTFMEAESWANIYQDLPIDVEIVFGRGFGKLHELLLDRADYYDLIWIGRPHNMDYFVSACLKFRMDNKTPVVYDSEAIFSERLKHMLDIGLDKITGKYVNSESAREYQLANHASAVVSVSEYEAELWKTKTAKPIFVFGHDCELIEPVAEFSSRKGILFLGTVYATKTPNWDSILWYVENVMPILKAKHNIHDKLSFVGKNVLPKEELEPYSDDIEFLGAVDDLKETINRHRIMVVPTRYAAGIPQKVFDAAKYGIPTVCTSIIANQMTWVDGNETLACNWKDPEGFADRCARLYNDENLWRKTGENARNWMKQQPDRDSLRDHLNSIITSMLQR